ncbi:hypothetical protein BDV19DRAFT_7929 [Aspergillus venezuelensis]
MRTSKRSIQLQDADPVFIARYRRNHKMQSCEPCRKSKVACDHRNPCGRCIRRRRVEECYYHPNPLSRDRQDTITTTTIVPSVLTAPHPSSAVPCSSIEQAGGYDEINALTTPPWSNSRPSYALPPRAGSAPPFFDPSDTWVGNHGFLGSTSHASIMTEDLTQLGITSTDLQQVPTVHVQKNPISREKLARGCRALSFLQNRAMIDRGIALFFQSVECVHIHCGEFIVRHWLSQLWLAHGETLSTQNPEGIRQLCHMLCENTATPQVFDGSTTARQWTYSATGRHIRWGVIAMIANYVGTYALVTNSSDPFFQEFNVDRNSLLSQMSEVSDICINICRGCNAVDDAFIWALFENYNITKYTKGEASYATYRISAEVSSALVAMGLHQEIKADNRVPFFLAELRKRVRALVYTEEISIATFLGRPPRLSHRYINLDLPLDLTDGQLFSDNPQELAAAIARLDQQGYNRDGELHHATWIRSSIGFVARKEDILELSLGNFTPDEVRRYAAIIQEKTGKHWATLPQFMLHLKDGTFGLERHQKLEATELYFQNVFRQGHLANSLLLHRVLMRKAGAGPSGLIKTAQTILSDVLRLYRRVEMSAATSFIYFLAVHGLRSAVILAIELLKQEQPHVSSYSVESLLPRSRTIQDLVVFVSKLSDLDPDPMFGDRELCEKGWKFLSRVLDKLLSRPDTKIADRPVQQLDANTLAFSNNMMHNSYVSDGYLTTVDFSIETSEPVSGADHEFRLWLENIDSQDWTL